MMEAVAKDMDGIDQLIPLFPGLHYLEHILDVLVLGFDYAEEHFYGWVRQYNSSTSSVVDAYLTYRFRICLEDFRYCRSDRCSDRAMI